MSAAGKSGAPSQVAKLLLMKQLKELSQDPPVGVEVWLEDDAELFKWSCR
jgi:ubiquitin-protein ligase